MGGGHGSYDAIFILFPFATFNVMFENQLSMGLFFLGFIQYPLYGFLLDLANEKGNIDKIATIILIAHIVLVCLIFAFKDPTNWG